MRDINNTRVGSIMSFTCNRGYRLVGLSSIMCNRDGNWNGRVPVCQGLHSTHYLTIFSTTTFYRSCDLAGT